MTIEPVESLFMFGTDFPKAFDINNSNRNRPNKSRAQNFKEKRCRLGTDFPKTDNTSKQHNFSNIYMIQTHLASRSKHCNESLVATRYFYSQEE